MGKTKTGIDEKITNYGARRLPQTDDRDYQMDPCPAQLPKCTPGQQTQRARESDQITTGQESTSN